MQSYTIHNKYVSFKCSNDKVMHGRYTRKDMLGRIKSLKDTEHNILSTLNIISDIISVKHVHH